LKRVEEGNSFKKDVLPESSYGTFYLCCVDEVRPALYAGSSQSEPKVKLANSLFHLFIQIDCGGLTHEHSCIEICEPGSRLGMCGSYAGCLGRPGFNQAGRDGPCG
jgi:hypothetical protein